MVKNHSLKSQAKSYAASHGVSYSEALKSVENSNGPVQIQIDWTFEFKRPETEEELVHMLVEDFNSEARGRAKFVKLIKAAGPGGGWPVILVEAPSLVSLAEFWTNSYDGTSIEDSLDELKDMYGLE